MVVYLVKSRFLQVEAGVMQEVVCLNCCGSFFNMSGNTIKKVL